MLRKISFIGMTSFAVIAPCFAGFYLGAGGGPEGAYFNQRSHVIGNGSKPPVDVTVPSGVFNVIATNNLSGIGGFGTVFAGYGWRQNRYYLAGEINGTWSSVEYRLINDEYIHANFAKTYFTMRSSGGIGLLPGFFLTETSLLYGRVGYVNRRLKIIEGADPSINNISKNLDGIRYGIGIAQELSPEWALRLDYSQINYSEVHSFTSFTNAGVTKSTTIRPSTAQVALGILYQFDRPVIYSK